MPALADLYKTLPLPLDPKSEPKIRLLHISALTSTSNGGKVSGPIQCTLSAHRLRDPNLKFAALSYEWGRPYKPKPGHPAPELVVNNKTIPVQPNLEHALRHLLRGLQSGGAKATPKLVIWVDAICINQNDNSEKTNQVGLMAEIYGRAETTYGWLGLASDKSDIAMAALDFVGRKMLEKPSPEHSSDEKPQLSPLEKFEELNAGAAVGEWNRHSPDELLTLAPDLMGKFLPDASFPAPEVRALLARGYWNRMWIQQELVISPNVILCCGDAQLPVTVFEGAMVFLRLLMHHATYGVIAKYKNQTTKELNETPGKEDMEESSPWTDLSKWTEAERKNYELLSAGWSAEASVLRRLRARYTRSRESLSLMRVVAEAHSNSTNVRYEVSRHEDRIYGLAGLACGIPRLQSFGFRFIYDGSCAESYTNAARAIILSGGVDLVAFAGVSTTRIERMPSWVPDWRVPVRRPRGGFPWETPFCVSKGVEITTKADQDDADWDSPLTLTGCIVDTMDYMNPPWRPGQIGSRLQSRQAIGFLNDIANISWMAGERQKQTLQNDPSAVPIYSDDELIAAKFRIPVADQLQVGTSQVTSATSNGGKMPILAEGYLSVMRDLDWSFAIDTRLYIGNRHVLGVKFPGLPEYPDLEKAALPPKSDTTATMEEFNAKDSYYNMMDRQDRTRPFVGEKGYMGLVPELAEQGDVVVIFRGAKFPYVLRRRPYGRQAGTYEVIGEAYVYGIMDGEYVENEGLVEWEDFDLI